MFITTGGFTSAAKDYVVQSSKHIVLFGGEGFTYRTIKYVIVLYERGLHPPVCEPLLLPPLVADDSSQSVLPILSRRLRGHLIKREKSYVKEICGPQEGVQPRQRLDFSR